MIDLSLQCEKLVLNAIKGILLVVINIYTYGTMDVVVYYIVVITMDSSGGILLVFLHFATTYIPWYIHVVDGRLLLLHHYYHHPLKPLL